MKKILLIFGVLIFANFYLVTAQNYEIEYSAKQTKVFSPEEEQEFLEFFDDKAMGRKQMEQNTNPEPVDYVLLIDTKKELSEFRYKEKINNNQDPDEGVITVAPAGFTSMLVHKNDDFYVKPISVYSKKYTEKDSLVSLEITEFKEVEAILGFTTFYAKKIVNGRNYEFWFTDNLPSDVGPANMRVKNYFVLKASVEIPEWRTVQVYEAKKVTEKRKIKFIDYPETAETYTANEVGELYNKANEVRNAELRNQEIEDDF